MTGRSETSSEQLMQAVAGGDLGAFEEIVLRHQKQAWGIAYRFLGDPHAAEDVAQEAFLRILDAAPAYRPAAAFRTYLVRVVTRLCLDYAEKMRPVLADEPPDTFAGGPSPADQAEMVERDVAIQAALSALPPNQRMAIVLRYFEGLGWSEMSEVMGVSPKAVERLLSRGREALADRLLAFLED
jgi:RNA polymerase sigma-70 factor (ECF subfamily)